MHTSPVPASQLKEKILKHLSTKVKASKCPLSYQSLVTNLPFVPCQKHAYPSFPPSKSIWLHSVTFTFGLLRLLNKVSLMGETRRKHLFWETFGDFKTIWCFVRWVPKLHRYNTCIIITWHSQRVSMSPHFCSHFKSSLRSPAYAPPLVGEGIIQC